MRTLLLLLLLPVIGNAQVRLAVRNTTGVPLSIAFLHHNLTIWTPGTSSGVPFKINMLPQLDSIEPVLVKWKYNGMELSEKFRVCVSDDCRHSCIWSLVNVSDSGKHLAIIVDPDEIAQHVRLNLHNGTSSAIAVYLLKRSRWIDLFHYDRELYLPLDSLEPVVVRWAMQGIGKPNAGETILLKLDSAQRHGGTWTFLFTDDSFQHMCIAINHKDSDSVWITQPPNY